MRIILGNFDEYWARKVFCQVSTFSRLVRQGSFLTVSSDYVAPAGLFDIRDSFRDVILRVAPRHSETLPRLASLVRAAPVG